MKRYRYRYSSYFTILAFPLMSTFLCPDHQALASECDSLLEITKGMRTERLKSIRTLDTAWYVNLSKTEESNLSRDRDIGGTIPIDGVPIGGEVSASDQRTLRSALGYESLRRYTSFDAIDYAVMSGDPTIINNWLNCRRDERPHITMYMTAPESNKYILLHIVFSYNSRNPPPHDFVRLTERITVKNAAIIPSDLVKVEMGRDIPHRDGIIIHLEADSYDKPVYASLDGLIGGVPGQAINASTHLPPRIRLVPKSYDQWPCVGRAECGKPTGFHDEVQAEKNKNDGAYTGRYALPAEYVNEGYVIVADTISQANPTFYSHKGLTCSNLTMTVVSEGRAIDYKGTYSNGPRTPSCEWNPRFHIMRFVAEPLYP